MLLQTSLKSEDSSVEKPRSSSVKAHSKLARQNAALAKRNINRQLSFFSGDFHQTAFSFKSKSLHIQIRSQWKVAVYIHLYSLAQIPLPGLNSQAAAASPPLHPLSPRMEPEDEPHCS